MKDRLTTAPLPKERPQGSCGPCIVCWQDGINPYIISVLIRSAPWNAQSAAGTASGLLERPHGISKKPLFHTRYTRNRGGNVEQSWCFRGERFSFWEEEEKRYKSQTRDETFVSEAISDECECKITTFF